MLSQDHKYYLIRNFPRSSDSEKTLTPYQQGDTQYGTRCFNTLQSIKGDHSFKEIYGVFVLEGNDLNAFATEVKKALKAMEVRDAITVLIATS